jgi:site-specific DNA-cytosine methylase
MIERYIIYISIHMQAMGMDVRTVAVADKKNSARRFMHNHFPYEIQHMFSDVRALSDDQLDPICEMCNKTDECTYDRTTLIHLVTAGTPCQAYTGLRWQRGSGRDQGPVSEHSTFHIIQEFLYYLSIRKPLGFILEEVLGFLKKDPVTGRRWVDLFLAQVNKLGYAATAIRLGADPWISDVSRDRLAKPYKQCIRVHS